MIKVEHPYEYSSEEETTISSNAPANGKDWGKSVFDRIKENIKNYLLGEQNNICPYCGSRLHRDVMYPQVEHIAHKGEHFRFMFESRNLVMSCVPCNIHKGVKETLVDPLVLPYPDIGNAFQIVHPYFDNYFDHIELINGEAFIARTLKGEWTIDCCKLNREQLLTKKRKIRDINEQVDELEEKMQSLPQEDRDLFRKFIDNVRSVY